VQSQKAPARGRASLSELVSQALRRMQPYAHQAGLVFLPDLPSEAVPINVDPGLFSKALDGILSDAIRNAGSSGQVYVKVEKSSDNQGHLALRSGRVIDPKDVDKIFSETNPAPAGGPFAGLGIRLGLVQEIVAGFGGKTWFEAVPGKGSIFHLSLPLAR
jgi:signal transduction histidine kinase